MDEALNSKFYAPPRLVSDWQPDIGLSETKGR